MASHDSRTTWAPEREIVLCRVIAAPRERVFIAWTDPKQIVQWFGPGVRHPPGRLLALCLHRP